MGYFMDEAAAEVFDQTFPQKEKQILPGQLSKLASQDHRPEPVVLHFLMLF